MPGISTAGDKGDVAGGLITGGSADVFVEGKPVVRIGDPVSGHGRGTHAGPVMSSGSDTVLVNGIGVSRDGDIATCGHPASGSGTVSAN
jgi:uncharacterized Zn-binding protein involved in type VI secretion